MVPEPSKRAYHEGSDFWQRIYLTGVLTARDLPWDALDAATQTSHTQSGRLSWWINGTMATKCRLWRTNA
jgi:hypothetical protein